MSNIWVPIWFIFLNRLPCYKKELQLHCCPISHMEWLYFKEIKFRGTEFRGFRGYWDLSRNLINRVKETFNSPQNLISAKFFILRQQQNYSAERFSLDSSGKLVCEHFLSVSSKNSDFSATKVAYFELIQTFYYIFWLLHLFY